MTEHQIDRLWIVVALIWVVGMVMLFTVGCAKPKIVVAPVETIEPIRPEPRYLLAPPEPLWKLPSGLAGCSVQERTHYSDGTWRIILECSDSYKLVKR